MTISDNKTKAMAMRWAYTTRVAMQGKFTQEVRFVRYVGCSKTTHETNMHLQESVLKCNKRN
jgi:hypothetical protein